MKPNIIGVVMVSHTLHARTQFYVCKLIWNGPVNHGNAGKYAREHRDTYRHGVGGDWTRLIAPRDLRSQARKSGPGESGWPG
jgi:hypothetical protein